MGRRPWSPRPLRRKVPWRKVGVPRYLTHYWDNETWEANRGRRGTLSAIYGNQFFRRGVAIGDLVYVVTVRNGNLLLGGRLEVGSRTKYDKPIVAEWMEEIRAKPDSATDFDAAMEVPRELAERLVITSYRGPVALKFDEAGLYHQRMRTMRELTPESAAELECLLDLRPH